MESWGITIGHTDIMQTESKPTGKNIRSYLHILCDNPELLWTDNKRSTGQSYDIDVMHLYLF